MADCGGFGSIDVLVKASGFSDAALRLVIGLFSGNFDYIVCGEQYLPDDDYILDNHGVESRVTTTLEKSYLFFMFSYSLLHRRQSRSSQVFILVVYLFFLSLVFLFWYFMAGVTVRGTLDRSTSTNENVIYDLFVSGLGENQLA